VSGEEREREDYQRGGRDEEGNRRSKKEEYL